MRNTRVERITYTPPFPTSVFLRLSFLYLSFPFNLYIIFQNIQIFRVLSGNYLPVPDSIL